MSDRPTISVYLDDHIADVGYYRNWTGYGLLWECCDLAKRLDGCRSYAEVQSRLGKLSEDSGFPPSPELSPEFNAPEHDVKLTQMLAPLAREGGHHPDEDLMLEMESYSEFPIVIDLSRRCFYYAHDGFSADDMRIVGWQQWIGDNGADRMFCTTFGSTYDYWASSGMAVSLDDVDDLVAWLEADRRDIEIVYDPDVSAEELARLAREGNRYVRTRIAEMTDDEDLLDLLARDEVFWVREMVGQNKHASDELLLKLAEDDCASVRLSVGLRYELPESVARVFAQDSDPAFRAKLARESGFTVARLLVHDEDEGVRKAVAGGFAVPEDVLAILAKDENEGVRVAVARSNFLPDDLAAQLAEDKSEQVRLAIAAHIFQTPQEVLRKLTNDESPKVRRAAERSLRLSDLRYVDDEYDETFEDGEFDEEDTE